MEYPRVPWPILLNLIYINYISNVCRDSDIILFADDTNIFLKSKTKHSAFESTNKILKDISLYMALNKLHIDLDKSCFMYFKEKSKYSLSTENENIPIMIGSTEIKQVSGIKF